MKKNELLSKAGTLVIGLLFILGSFSLGTYVGQSQASEDTAAKIENKDLGKPENVDFSLFWKAWNVLDEKYVATQGTSTASTTAQERVYGAIQGMTAAFGDPYTVFFPPEEAKSFEDEIAGNFEGVGMEVGVKDGVLTVISPLKGTPAFRAGIQAGDKIIKINDSVATGMSVDEAIKIIRGKKGTEVTFTLQREGQDEPVVIKVIRDVIDIPTIESYKRADGVFVIKLFSFTDNSPSLFRNALREFTLAKSDKLILDLRGNPGGYLEAAVDMASWFLPTGKVIVREDFGEGKAEEVERSKGYNVFNDNLKFAILIDGGSASASEILAGALQEYGKAKVVGTKSFGKGSVQELVKITSETSLKVTIARWLTPKGVSISDNGVVPDVIATSTPEDAKNGIDTQMEKAAELLKK